MKFKDIKRKYVLYVLWKGLSKTFLKDEFIGRDICSKNISLCLFLLLFKGGRGLYGRNNEKYENNGIGRQNEYL